MNSTKKTARIAGLLYLVNGVTGFFGIIYVPSRLIVSGNAAATANNIAGIGYRNCSDQIQVFVSNQSSG